MWGSKTAVVYIVVYIYSIMVISYLSDGIISFSAVVDSREIYTYTMEWMWVGCCGRVYFCDETGLVVYNHVSVSLVHT